MAILGYRGATVAQTGADPMIGPCLRVNHFNRVHASLHRVEAIAITVSMWAVARSSTTGVWSGAGVTGPDITL
jgi:hypothetical protein